MKLILTNLILLFFCLLPYQTFGDDGKCIEGDCENGKGTMTWSSGMKYEGEFKDWTLNGQGTYTHPDGSKYEGTWKDGKPNGMGTKTYNKLLNQI